MSEEFRKRLEKVIKDFEEEFKELVNNIEDLLNKGEVREAYKLWKERSREIIMKLRDSLEDLEELSRNIDEENLDAILNDFKETINNVVDSVSKRLNELFKRVRGLGTSIFISIPSFGEKPSVFIRSFGDVIKSLDSVFREVDEAIEEGLKSISRRVTEVVSTRIGKRELEIIDKLVDIGIFRSRSEAVAYFVRRGIEASKDLIDKALEHAKKIKELQESIKKEFRDLGEEDKKS
ncbi:MAG: ribbon-helix-helix domain-containing protein [Ignisphaera sp.]